MFCRFLLITLTFSSFCTGACKNEPETVPTVRKESLSEKERTELSARILTKMIDDELMVQYAGTVGIQITQEEVENELDNIKASGGGNAAFILFLQDKGLSEDRVRANLRRNMIVKRLMEQIRSAEVVSDKEAAEYHQAHPDSFRTPGTVALAHILIKKVEGAQDAVILASKIRKEIQAGLPFDRAAEKYSQDLATRGQGGALGVLTLGEMHPDLETAAFSVTVGTVSAPVESPLGVHLLKVIRRKPGNLLPLSQIESQVREEIIDSRTELKVKELVERLNLEGQVERKAKP
jgi:parvulin-like peptidyl-prolyl isomerase